jgi:hypothetical protein
MHGRAIGMLCGHKKIIHVDVTEGPKLRVVGGGWPCYPFTACCAGSGAGMVLAVASSGCALEAKSKAAVLALVRSATVSVRAQR